MLRQVTGAPKIVTSQSRLPSAETWRGASQGAGVAGAHCTSAWEAKTQGLGSSQAPGSVGFSLWVLQKVPTVNSAKNSLLPAAGTGKTDHCEMLQPILVLRFALRRNHSATAKVLSAPT